MRILAGFFLGLGLLATTGEAQDAKLNPNIPREAMGNGLFNQQGANSCVYCHGVGGVGGSVKTAANLQKPKSWKIYKILGGDAAFAKDKDGFKSKMKEATLHLLLKGAIVHNSSFKKPWYDLAKAGAPYDGQMLGMTAPPSRSWLKKYKEKYGVTPEVASESLYLYIQSLSKSDVL
ncbi:MAG: hypothetical protein R3A80_11205 [Bdellovibrionota bacterium]